MTDLRDRSWRHDPWDDPDITDTLVVERPRPQMRRYSWVVWFLAFLGLAALVIVGVFGLWYTEKVTRPAPPANRKPSRSPWRTRCIRWRSACTMTV